MNAATREARAKAFQLRKQQQYDSALCVLRDAWKQEPDKIARACISIDAAYALAGQKKYSNALSLLEEAETTEGLGDPILRAIDSLKSSIRTRSSRPVVSKKAVSVATAAFKKKNPQWRKQRKARIRVISSKFVPAKYKPASRKGWRRDVGY